MGVTREPVIWEPKRNIDPPGVAMPGWGAALARGVAMRCPACGRASAFRGFARISEACASCGALLGAVPGDLLGPYLTISAVLAVVGVAMTIVDRGGRLDYATSLAVFLPIAILLDLALLRPMKGLVLGVMMKVNAPQQAKK
jgi:uncharacterized protein (DUF983 family)